MKRMFLLLTGICVALTLTAQTDTTGKSNQSDTIRIGGMIIINKKGKPCKNFLDLPFNAVGFKCPGI